MLSTVQSEDASEDVRHLQAQMAAKQQAKAQEKALAAQELLEAERAEAEYQQKMQAVLSGTSPQIDFRRKKVEWFS